MRRGLDMSNVGPFKLVNPPDGQEEIIRAARKILRSIKKR